MIRPIAFLVGIFFSGMMLYSFGHSVYNYETSPPPENVYAKFHLEPKDISFPSDGPFGRYDREQLQRGFKVFHDVCSGCHSLKQVAFRDLADLGYSPAQIKNIAANWPVQTPSINPDTGEPATRKSTPADHIPSPYANDTAARAANNNALPPDLSNIVKSREGGNRYVYSLLTGWANPPANLPKANLPAPGLHYNPYFANLNLAMPPPLTTTGQVTFDDGTKATVPQMAYDVAAFLTWASEPKMEARKADGVATVLFLIIATVFAYFAYQDIWYEKKHPPVRPQAA